MRLICPNCVAQYEVDEDVIPPEGRDVQCANCGHNWFQDALQMLSTDAETPSGIGDPDSDVPPELFNDLEGKLNTEFTSARAHVAPDPNDMEPEEPRDDFQIEQEPEAPSTRLDKEALDILHTEAEYSSGEKPPAATEAVDVSEEPPAEDMQEPPEEVISTSKTEPAVGDDDPMNAVPGKDDLDEIRRRIKDLEAQEELADLGQHDTLDPSEEITQADAIDELVASGLDNAVVVESQKPTPEQTAGDHNPFSRPVNGDPSVDENDPVPASTNHQYEENIPFEESISAALAQTNPVDDNSAPLTSDHVDETEIIADNQPRNRVSPRPFPKIGDTGDTPGDLYNTPQERAETRKDMFPDVDELSSEIASDAKRSTYEHQPEEEVKTQNGFLKGFKYAILLCIMTGIIYLSQPVIVKYVPEAEPYLNLLTEWVNKAADLLNAMIDMIV
ncbi:MAG: zinc-ribbon domain-containing protein [Amylibacter sp.]